MSRKGSNLNLESQLCFPLYACSRAVIKQYTPLLEALDLTYTQYITMLVLWEEKALNVKSLGKALYLDSGTLTPLLKKLEKKGLIERSRSSEDERNLIVTLTEQGEQLHQKALQLDIDINEGFTLSDEEKGTLKTLLEHILDDVR